MSGIVIGVGRVAARLANEQALALSVLLLAVSALVTRLGRISRIDRDQEDTLAFCFVGEERTELRKTPTMESSALFLAVSASFPNACQVFEGEGVACLQGSQNGVRNPMVEASLKPCPAPGHFLKVAFGALCAFGLESRAEMTSWEGRAG